jgi:HlyD family secretion protein
MSPTAKKSASSTSGKNRWRARPAGSAGPSRTKREMGADRLQWLLPALIGIFIAGCDSRPPAPAESESRGLEDLALPSGVYAQGLIMPSGGLIKLFAKPGDILANLPVSTGQKVEQGQLLAVMQSESRIAAQRATLAERKANAEREHADAIRQAELLLASKRLNQQRARSQKAALFDREKLIQIGQQQLSAAENVLENLIAISSDQLTSDFVGSLEIQRQTVSVNEARMQLLEQESQYRRGIEEAELALEAAAREIDAAEDQLVRLREVNPGRIFDLQLESLETEFAQSVLNAPTDGVIVAINGTLGGSATQLPLIEMAGTQRFVCEAEVNVVDASRLSLGQTARLFSRALPKPLTGRVIEKGILVGRPRLRAPDPLAAADYRTLSVLVEIEESNIAQEWIQLQVDVVFDSSELR